MNNPLVVIGRSELLTFPDLGLLDVPARIDTGAKTSSIWASNISESNGVLTFCLFGEGSKYYDGKPLRTKHYQTRVVASSTGHLQERYVVQLVVILKARRIRASFTLANRSQQAYPVLIGRNILRGKFLVDVKQGAPIVEVERIRSKRIQSLKQSKEAS
jgi:hypothetical protein